MSVPAARPRGLAALLLRLVARIVPGDDRRAWLEGWDAELLELESRRARGGTRTSPLRFALGALPHSLWERKEWTMAILLQDVRYAWRVLVRTPGFTLLAILTVALGVGASTTVFSLVSSTVLRPPAAIADPDGLIQIGRQNTGGYDAFAFPFVRAFSEAGSVSAVAAYSYETFLVGRGEATRPTAGLLVTGEYFELLGVPTPAGRPLGPADDAEAGPQAVVSDRYWRERLGADPAAVGSELWINGSAYRIAGIAAPGFHGTDVAMPPADVWLPLSRAGAVLGPGYADYDRPGFSWLWVIGRRAGGSGIEQVRAELDAIYRREYRQAWGEAAESGVMIAEGVGLRPEERETLQSLVSLLLGIVIVVMAVASANLGSLMLARSSARLRELGVRAAMGASRGRIVRQILTECVLLALAGGAAALVATIWTARTLPWLLPWTLGVEIAPDRNVLLFGLVCSLAVGLLFGLLPALRASSTDAVRSLRGGSGSGGRGGQLMRRGLVVGQLALSSALLILVGLLAQSLWNAQSADPGFATRDVLVARLDLTLSGYAPDDGRALRRTLLERLRSLPGVRDVAIGLNVPFGGWSRQSVPLPEPLPDGTPWFEIDSSVVSEGYFETLGIPLRDGEGFPAGRRPPADGVVLSESAARMLFPDSDPLAGTLTLPSPDTEASVLRVVGVVADVRNRGLRIDPRPSMYLSDSGEYRGRTVLFLRTDVPPLTLESTVRQIVARIDPDLAIIGIESLHERMGGSLRDTLLVGRLAGVFGVLAILLAAVGLYGLVAYLATQRTHELGVRLALGAAAGNVLGLIARQGLGLGALGLALGVGLSIPASGFVRSLLYGVDPQAPLPILVAVLTLLAVVTTASLVPAFRATRIDPVRALRAD